MSTDHIKDLFQQGIKATRSYYTGAARVAFDSARTTAQSCIKCDCRFKITRTLLCMQCPLVHCPKDAELHSVDMRHVFGAFFQGGRLKVHFCSDSVGRAGIDSRSGHIYCFLCNDFIYDPTLEEIRMEREASVEGNRRPPPPLLPTPPLTQEPARKRRRTDTHNPSPEDLKYIDTNTTAAPCRATGLRGFLNMGSTCFMSVVLQSLIHNPLVRNFYLSDGHKPKECTTTNCMSCAMDEVFSEFFATDKTDGFGPVNLLTTSWKCGQALAGYQQQDAHEYLQFLLNQLHITNGGNDDPCKCIIHRSFYGKLQSDVTCEGCANVTTAFDPVMDLSLDLRIKAKKKSAEAAAAAAAAAAAGSASEPTMQTLQECLERFTSAEKLGVDNYTCGNCPGPQGKSALKQLTVKQLPPVLCIQLKVPPLPRAP